MVYINHIKAVVFSPGCQQGSILSFTSRITSLGLNLGTSKAWNSFGLIMMNTRNEKFVMSKYTTPIDDRHTHMVHTMYLWHLMPTMGLIPNFCSAAHSIAWGEGEASLSALSRPTDCKYCFACCWACCSNFCICC